jgi:hypothetical protein
MFPVGRTLSTRAYGLEAGPVAPVVCFEHPAMAITPIQANATVSRMVTIPSLIVPTALPAKLPGGPSARLRPQVRRRRACGVDPGRRL